MTPTINDFRWLSGMWQGKTEGEHIDEQWSAPTGETMVAAFRQFKDNTLKFYELIALEKADDSIVMRIRHFHPGLIAWEDKDEMQVFTLVEAEENRAHFERQNPDDSRTALRYRRRGDTLTVTMSNTSPDNTTTTHEYTFHWLSMP